VNNVVIIKFIGGDQVTGILEEETDTTITLAYPLETLCEFNLENMKHNLFMIKWQPFSMEETTTLNKNTIISLSNVADSVIDYYHERVEEIYLSHEMSEAEQTLSDDKLEQVRDQEEEMLEGIKNGTKLKH
jgi:hypothetical protein